VKYPTSYPEEKTLSKTIGVAILLLLNRTTCTAARRMRKRYFAERLGTPG
jgi:hypothetical protein